MTQKKVNHWKAASKTDDPKSLRDFIDANNLIEEIESELMNTSETHKAANHVVKKGISTLIANDLGAFPSYLLKVALAESEADNKASIFSAIDYRKVGAARWGTYEPSLQVESLGSSSTLKQLVKCAVESMNTWIAAKERRSAEGPDIPDDQIVTAALLADQKRLSQQLEELENSKGAFRQTLF
jgi:hypothetical protein